MQQLKDAVYNEEGKENKRETKKEEKKKIVIYAGSI